MTEPSWAGPFLTPEGRHEVLVPCDTCRAPVYQSSRSQWRAQGRRDCGLFCESGVVTWVTPGVPGAEVVTMDEYAEIAGHLDPDFDWPIPVASRDGEPLYLRPLGAGVADRVVALPCPSWCALSDRSGHVVDGFEYTPAIHLHIRAHETPTEGDGRYWANVFAYEALHPEGTRAFGTVRVDANVEDDFGPMLYRGLSPSEARQFAARLVEAADLADRIEADRRSA